MEWLFWVVLVVVVVVEVARARLPEEHGARRLIESVSEQKTTTEGVLEQWASARGLSLMGDGSVRFMPEQRAPFWSISVGVDLEGGGASRQWTVSLDVSGWSCWPDGLWVDGDELCLRPEGHAAALRVRFDAETDGGLFMRWIGASALHEDVVRWCARGADRSLAVSMRDGRFGYAVSCDALGAMEELLEHLSLIGDWVVQQDGEVPDRADDLLVAAFDAASEAGRLRVRIGRVMREQGVVSEALVVRLIGEVFQSPEGVGALETLEMFDPGLSRVMEAREMDRALLWAGATRQDWFLRLLEVLGASAAAQPGGWRLHEMFGRAPSSFGVTKARAAMMRAFARAVYDRAAWGAPPVHVHWRVRLALVFGLAGDDRMEDAVIVSLVLDELERCDVEARPEALEESVRALLGQASAQGLLRGVAARGLVPGDDVVALAALELQRAGWRQAPEDDALLAWLLAHARRREASMDLLELADLRGGVQTLQAVAALGARGNGAVRKRARQVEESLRGRLGALRGGGGALTVADGGEAQGALSVVRDARGGLTGVE